MLENILLRMILKLECNADEMCIRNAIRETEAWIASFAASMSNFERLFNNILWRDQYSGRIG